MKSRVWCITAGSARRLCTGQNNSDLARFGSWVSARSCCWRNWCKRPGAKPSEAPQRAAAAGPARRVWPIFAPAFLRRTKRRLRLPAFCSRPCCSLVRRRLWAVTPVPKLV
eukprot:5946783-Amphidinium_carterae.2